MPSFPPPSLPVVFTPLSSSFRLPRLYLSPKLARVPGVGADAGVVDGVGIDDDGLGAPHLELHVAEVEGGGLEGVEEETRNLGIELAGDHEADDLHEGDLDGVGVFEKGEGECGLIVSLVGGLVGGWLGFQGDLLALPFFVKETEALFAQGRGAALGAISFDVSATRDVNVVEHEEYPPPPRSFGINEIRGRGAKIFEFKGLTRKIRKTKEIGSPTLIHFRYRPL